MALNVGELVAYLKFDMGDYDAGIAKANLAADKLDGKEVDVKVKASTAAAEAKLAAVAAAEDRLGQYNLKVADSGEKAGKGMGALVTAVIMLGPALVPLAAGAAGLAVGFGAMGTAGVLAIVGIHQEMAKGTPMGLQYTSMLATLKGDLTTLGHTAASGTLAPFQQAVADLQQRMPVLNAIVGEFSVISGKTAGVLTTGLVAAFIALAPLARDAGVYVLDLSQRFATLMSGSGVTSFGDYIRSVFPQVMQAVESVVTAALHLVAALAPLGLGTLGILRTLADLINALPVDVLSTLAVTAASVYIGFSAFKMLDVPIHGVGVAMRFMGTSALFAADAMGVLRTAAGVIGAILTVATLLYSANAESVRKNQQATNDYTEALRQSNGVIDENIRKLAFKSIQEVDGFRTGAQYGATQKELVDAALQLGDAQAVVNAKLGAGVTALKDGKSYGEQYAAQGSDAAKKLSALGAVLDVNNAALKGGIQGEKDWAAANATGAGATDANAAAQQALAAKIGTTSAALVLATTGQQTTADATAQATAKMYLENNAAGILKNTLDLLNGKTLSAADAQNEPSRV